MTDIIVNGVTYNGVEAIAMQGTSGETVKFYPETAGYLIVFYGNGGTSEVFSAHTDASGKLESLPTATREGYTFLGWQAEDGTDVTTETVFTADVLVMAQWSRNTKIITVTGKGNSSSCYIIIGETKVTEVGSYEVAVGDIITCYVASAFYGEIYLNEEQVVRDTKATYEYTVTVDATIELSYSSARGTVTITEE